MKTIIVKQKMRLSKAILEHFPDMTQGLLYKYTRENKIKVNKKKINITQTVNVGDVIHFYVPDKYVSDNDEHIFLKAKNIVDIIYEDENILILNKPSGTVSIDETNKAPDTLINRAILYLYNKNAYAPSNTFTPSLCHRLDTGTSGAIIIAKNEQALISMVNAIKERKILKKYICVTINKPALKKAYLKSFLYKNPKQGKVYIYDTYRNGAKEIETKYKVLCEKGSLSLLEVELITGRTHQIRAQLSHIGCPILGDGKYGINLENKKHKTKYQLLCANKIIFTKKPSAPCEYLYSKEFSVKKPWFVDNFFNGLLK